ncbi:DNA-binding response regulator, OmpR family, contains REC and winged-helix (wHTH) domain [Marininema mesophilum]|uniref:DNA-binding response regulator, OmpR family, contains REC and winged-helix (WHTH) domain n=1 Tax=Marininema mesophilum TaxID=1048340 RepID=A0A1H2Z4M9_9BACL|nr:response regulator transcription factor [Marininema mesophilum]SDX11958.1 DNA-binding response regulator, OmpR family, contains REC and winged-helix (wHTH) domain [Marininema mesophilum]
MNKIMIVEDDPKISSLLQSHLEKYGYQGIVAEDFDLILHLFEKEEPQLVLLDVNLPKYDGFYWCRKIRLISTCPILFISAREGMMDQVIALQNGADDYITKPFYPEVVVAKIESHLRRAYGKYAGVKPQRMIKVSNLILYPDILELELEGKKTELSHKETALLELLLEHANQVVGREYLLDVLWDDHQFVDGNTLTVYVTRTRKKLKDVGVVGAIETIRGAGYRFKETWGDE